MRIKKLTIHNIASIENAGIDFSQAPLSDSDVFLITGDTGSGKSTILDAICLALYATTPRMKNTEMEGAIIEGGNNEVQVEDPRRLLREGTGEGFVELEFDGANGIPYRAIWTVRRASEKVTGRLQPKRWSLTNLRTGKELNKDKEISAEIAAATGLASFDQFCRTTMLAQGEFTRFLNSKDEEKAAILEKITGADIYARIGKKIYELSTQKAKEYNTAKQEAEGDAPLSKDDRDAKEAEFNALDDQFNAESDQKKQTENKLQFLRNERNLNGELKDAVLKLKEAEDAVNTDDFMSMSALVKQYDETTEVRAHLATFESKTKKVKDAEEDICKLADTYTIVRAGLAYLKLQKSQLQGELDNVQGALEEEKPNLTVIEKAQTVKGHLKTMKDGEESIAKWAKEIANLNTEINETFNPSLEEKKKEWSDAKDAHSLADSNLKKAIEAVKEANLPEVRESLKAKRDLAASIKLAKVQLAALSEAIDARNKEMNGIEEDGRNLVKLKNQKTELEGELNTKLEVFKTAETTYNKVKLAEETRVEEIRSSLSEGDMCPVCRQKIVSTLPSSAEISAIVQPAKDAYTNAKRQKEELEEDLRNLNSRIKVDNGNLERRKKQYETVNPVPEKEQDALEILKKCGFGAITETTDGDLKALSVDTEAAIEALEKKDREGKLLESKVEETREEERKKYGKIEEAKHALDVVENQMKEKKGGIEQFERLTSNERTRVSEAESALAEILAGSRWEDDWKQDLSIFEDALENAVQIYTPNKKREDELVKHIGAITNDMEAIENQLKVVEEKESSWSSIPAQAPMAVPDLKSKAEHLKDDVLVNESTLVNAREEANRAGKKVETFLSEHTLYTKDLLGILSALSKTEVDQKKQEVSAALDAIKAAKAVKKDVEERQIKLLEDKPEIGEEDTEDSLDAAISGSNARIQDLAVQRAFLQQELNDDDKKREKQSDLQDKVEKLKIDSDRWARLNEIFGNADGKLFRKIAQSYVLGSLVHVANEYMTKLTDRYTLKVHPGTFIIELEDAYQGFASRVASTISGGESFLVSLSLALALSDIGTGLSVDTIFIDEGFGTLSGEPLQRAVDTLKSLNKQIGRHVGIISHIKDLREKIPVKIMVEQAGHSSASTVKVVDS